MASLPKPPDGYNRTHIKWQDPQPGWMEFDAVLRQTVDHDGEVTEHPVDTAAQVADHYRQRSIPITLETIITNSPLRLPQTHRGDVAETTNVKILELRQPIFQGAPTSVGGFDISAKSSVRIETKDFTEPLDRVSLIYEELRQIQEEARVLSVALYGIGSKGGAGYFDNMLLKRFQMDQDPSMTNAVNLSLELQQVIFADVLRADISATIPKEPKKQRSNNAKKAGKKPADAKINDKPTEERMESWWSRLSS